MDSKFGGMNKPIPKKRAIASFSPPKRKRNEMFEIIENVINLVPAPQTAEISKQLSSTALPEPGRAKSPQSLTQHF